MAAESNALTLPSGQDGILLLLDRPVERGGVVYVCVDDGFPGGFPIGRAIRGDDGTWCAYARVRPGQVFADDRVATGLADLRMAVRKVLAHARYTDVPAARWEAHHWAGEAGGGRVRGHTPGACRAARTHHKGEDARDG